MKAKNREKTRFGVLPGTISIQIREPGSAITHFVGLILVWIGAFPLMQRSIEHGSFITSLSMLVFIISTTLLYTASTLYHSVVLDLKKTMIFRKIDHTMISVLIAGTYTPVCLTALKGFTGYMLLTAILENILYCLNFSKNLLCQLSNVVIIYYIFNNGMALRVCLKTTL